MKPTLWILLGALTASVALNVESWLSQPEPVVPHARPAFSVDQLELTDAQRAELTSCCAECCAPHDEIRSDVEAKQAALQAALADPEVDAAEVRRLASEVGELRRELLEASVATMLRVRQVLTPEQLEVIGACSCLDCR